MRIAESADKTKAVADFRKAFEYEKAAAMVLAPNVSPEVEPTRSVLFRSAASLAMNAEDPVEAESMILMGLEGDPPQEIKDELCEIWDKIRPEKSN